MAERAAALQTYTAKLLKTREETELRRRELHKEIEELTSESTKLHTEIKDLNYDLKGCKETAKAKQAELSNLVVKLNGYESALSKIVESAQLISQFADGHSSFHK